MLTSFREHIFRDLRPYICTYAECATGDQVYDSWKDWTTHERWTHNKAWRCTQHTNDLYFSALTFKQHLHQEHSPVLSGSEVEEALRTSEIVSDAVARACPLCNCSMSDSSQLQNHIATHLQRIALFALPRSHDIQDASEAGSSSSQVDALSQGSQTLSSEHGTDKNPSHSEQDMAFSGYTPKMELQPATKLTFEAINSLPALKGSEDHLWRVDLLIQADVDDTPLQNTELDIPPEATGSRKSLVEGGKSIREQQDDTALDVNTDPEMRDSASQSLERARSLLQNCLT